MGLWDNMKNFVIGEEEEPEEGGFYQDEAENEEETFYSKKEEPTKGKYLNIHSSSSLSVVLVKPETFAEATDIADHLNAKKTVVLNLESASKDVSRRLVDFLSGAAYANNGNLKRIANCTFLITPNNVDFAGDEILDGFENSGMYI